MSILPSLVTLLYLLLVLGLCTYLLIRGITHAFVALFACGALLHMIPPLGYLALRQTAGGVPAYSRYIGFLTIFGAFGTICFAAGFILLARFLLGASSPAAQPAMPASTS